MYMYLSLQMISVATQEQSDGKTELEIGTGPIASSLDDVLKKHKIHRQAYHGKSFVGNHVSKCCKVRAPKMVVFNFKLYLLKKK